MLLTWPPAHGALKYAVHMPGFRNDPSIAPYFSGYFEDPGFLPRPAEQLWAEGKINPEAIMVGAASEKGPRPSYSLHLS